MEKKPLINIDTNTLIILGIFLYLLFNGFFEKETVKIETESITKTEFLKQLDSAINSKVAAQPVKKVKAAIQPNYHVRVLQENEPLQDNEKEIPLNEVKDTLQLENATVFSTLLTDGKIYSHSAFVETNDKIITTNNTITKTVAKSGTFLNIEPVLNVTGKFYGGEISIDRTIKNKIRFGAGVGYNDKLPIGEKVYLKAKLGIKF